MKSKFTGKEIPESEIVVESMFGAYSKKAAVCITWGEKQGMLTPKEALAHAARVIECATASESDEVFVKWLSGTGGLSEEAIVAAMLDLRRLREEIRTDAG